MKAIRLSHGVMFVKCNGVTVRVLTDGECSLAPMDYDVLEWDLRTESPDSWEYISEGEIREMDGDIYKKILGVADDFNALLGLK